MKQIIKNTLLTALCYYLLYIQFAPIELAALPVWQSVTVLIFAALSFALATVPAVAGVLFALEERGQR